MIGLSTNICGAKTRAGTPCQRPAGWGTNHVGEWCCKLHGGCTPRHSKRGPDHPEFKHGLYAKHLGEDEKMEFEEFVQRFELIQVTPDELYGLYRAMKALLAPGAIPPLVMTKALQQIASWKRAHHEMASGTKVQISFDQPEMQALIDRFRGIIVKYVPADKHQEVLNELQAVEAESGL